MRGFNDPNALQLASGKSVFHQPDEVSADGYLLPFHLDTSSSNAQKLPSTNHGWKTQHESWNGGKMDNWLPAHRQADKANGPYVMGHFTRADIPFHFALAEAFTICDAYHCSVMGPTYPNRLYWMTGTNHPLGTEEGAMMGNRPPPYGAKWKTYPERLEEAGVSWKVYHRETKKEVTEGQMDTMNFGFNVLGCFPQYEEAAPGSPLNTKAMTPSAEDQFRKDVLSDSLPAVFLHEQDDMFDVLKRTALRRGLDQRPPEIRRQKRRGESGGGDPCSVSEQAAAGQGKVQHLFSIRIHGI